MMRDLQKNEVEIAISVDIRDGGGSELEITRHNVETDIDRHSHIGSVLAETILAIEQGDPEAFCRIVVAFLGSGRRILADVANDAEISTAVLKRFAQIMDETESMNFGDFNSDDEVKEEGNNGFHKRF